MSMESQRPRSTRSPVQWSCWVSGRSSVLPRQSWLFLTLLTLLKLKKLPEPFLVAIAAVLGIVLYPLLHP